jgi:hypothetical protein
MYYARERRSRQIVAADKAKAWGDYTCPTCKAAVSLRSGKYRVDHFAHMPGQGKPDCEEFHPSDDLTRSWQTASPPPEAQPVDPLLVSIELEPDYERRRGPRKWILRLTVPKAHDAHGQVSIDLGGGDKRKISLTKLSLEPQTYTANIESEDFAANWVSPEVKPEYRAAVEHRVAGLDPQRINVFAAVRAKLKPRTNVLCWGEGYYFVSALDRPVTFPAGIVGKALASNQAWACSLVVLPYDPDPEVAAWLEQHCELPLIRSKRDWALVYPAPYSIDDDGSLQIPSNTEIVLALKSIDADHPGELTCSNGQASIAVELSGVRQHLVQITGSQRADKHIYLSWDGSHVASVVTTPYSDGEREPSVVLMFDGAADGARAELHRASGQSLMARVRSGELSLVGMSGHPMLQGELRWRRCGSADWTKEPVVFVTGARPSFDAKLTAERVSEINAAVQDHGLDVELDFGPFGHFLATAIIAPRVDTQSATLRIPRPLRARLEWLSQASHCFVDGHVQPVARLSDTALLHHFSQLNVPAKLLTHRRALERDIGALLEGGRTP